MLWNWRIHMPTTKAPMVRPVIRLRLRSCFECLLKYSRSCCLLRSCFWAGVRGFGVVEDTSGVFPSMFVSCSVTLYAARIIRQTPRYEQPRGVAVGMTNILARTFRLCLIYLYIPGPPLIAWCFTEEGQAWNSTFSKRKIFHKNVLLNSYSFISLNQWKFSHFLSVRVKYCIIQGLLLEFTKTLILVHKKTDF